MLGDSFISRLNNAPDVIEDRVIVKPGTEQILFETIRDGYLGGFINLDMLHSADEIEYELWVYAEDLEHPGVVKPYLSRHLNLKRSSTDKIFAPIMHISELRLPHGGYVLLRNTGGLSRLFQFYIYRRDYK